MLAQESNVLPVGGNVKDALAASPAVTLVETMIGHDGGGNGGGDEGERAGAWHEKRGKPSEVATG